VNSKTDKEGNGRGGTRDGECI